MPGAATHGPSQVPDAARAAIVGAAVAASLVATAALAYAPRTANGFAAVFPPWWSTAQAMNAAVSAGDITGVGALPFILILRSDAPGLEARLKRAGALILLDPRAAGVCAPPPPETRS